MCIKIHTLMINQSRIQRNILADQIFLETKVNLWKNASLISTFNGLWPKNLTLLTKCFKKETDESF